MVRRTLRPLSLLSLSLSLSLAAACGPGEGEPLEASELSSGLQVANGSGTSETFTATGRIDTSNEFFQSLGTNGRSCVTCHDPGDNWTIVPARLQQRFDATGGTDPIFRPND